MVNHFAIQGYREIQTKILADLRLAGQNGWLTCGWLGKTVGWVATEGHKRKNVTKGR